MLLLAEFLKPPLHRMQARTERRVKEEELKKQNPFQSES
jgi:hypothetical protein